MVVHLTFKIYIYIYIYIIVQLNIPQFLVTLFNKKI